jgi:Flp pilus assembly protein TadG
VEFALVAIFLLTLLFAIIDFGVFFAGRIAATNAARSAARYAATHPTAWSNSASPPSNSIQGKLVAAAVPARIANDDAHVTVSYVVPGVGGGTTCGQYSAASNGFVAASGYSQSTCVVAGSLIRVRAVYDYTFATPITGLVGVSQNFLTVDGEAAELEER